MRTVMSLFGLCFVTVLFAQQNAKFLASVESDTVNVEQIFKVTFTAKGGNAANFEAPAFEDFELVFGPNLSSQMSFVNGEMSQEVSYTFGLRPRTEGTFVIEQASILIEGKYLKTDFLKIVVDPNYIPKPAAQDDFMNPFEEFWHRSPFPKPHLSDPEKRLDPEKKPVEKKKRKVYRI